mgnify:CR=1 FL=1
MANKLITASFSITKELKSCLEQWAAADDRSASYILRDILEQECNRREAQQQPGNSGQAIKARR